MLNADIVLIVGAALLSAVVTGLAMIYAWRANLLDMPNRRSSHETATPRGGGLCIAVVFLGSVIALWMAGVVEYESAFAIVTGGGLIAGIGFADDHRDVPPLWRLLVQIIAAVLAVTILGGLSEIHFGGTVVDLGLAGDAAAVFCIVWFTNAFNFMDGIDGIAASEAICIAGGAWIVSSLTGGGVASALLVALSASSLGFLVWNWPPAKIFLGDVGSAFLGFCLVALAILTSGDGSISIWSWLCLSGVFIVDATVTLITRIVRRDNWLSAHRSHAYQIASRRYNSHRAVTISVIMINIVWLLPVACAATINPGHGWWLTIVAWTPLTVLSLWFGAGQSTD